MSVMVMDAEGIEAIYNKCISYVNNNECNIDYCGTIREYGYNNQERFKQLVKDWLYLNELSFNRRYREEDEPYLNQFLTFKTSHKINSYQMLKLLQFLVYNIELETIKHGFNSIEAEEITINNELMYSYNMLTKCINDIQTTIIAQMKDYKKCGWGELKKQTTY